MNVLQLKSAYEHVDKHISFLSNIFASGDVVGSDTGTYWIPEDNEGLIICLITIWSAFCFVGCVFIITGNVWIKWFHSEVSIDFVGNLRTMRDSLSELLLSFDESECKHLWDYRGLTVFNRRSPTHSILHIVVTIQQEVWLW